MPYTKAIRRQRRWTLLALLILVAAIWTTSLQQTLNSRKGCQRGTASYRVNAANWRIAQQARATAFAEDHKQFDGQAARSYGKNATALERLADTDCSSAYPLPFPLHL
jgi:hypothetical protein